MQKLFSSFFSFFISFSYCSEFSYCLPIGFFEDKRSLIYYVTQDQTSIHIAQNFESCLIQNKAELVNLPLAIPFCIFPIQPVLFFEGKGFSYFDQGILKSKYCAFRSPGTIYTSVVFDHTMGIHWYSCNHGILSILKNNFYVIYDLCLDDGTMILRVDNSIKKEHALFPFVFKESTFYVLESAQNSKIVVNQNTTSKILFETNASKIISFTFLNPSFGIFILYNTQDISETVGYFHIYYFTYNHRTMAFSSTYSCKIQIPFTILEKLSKEGLFPWCLQPIQRKSDVYMIDWVGNRFDFKKVISL